MNEQWGKYRLNKHLATGGMAEVYKAEMTGPEEFSKTVCLKRVRTDFSNKPEFVKMFVSEARIAATLHHPNIVQVFDFDTHEGRLFLAMEYVEGLDLYSIITEVSRLGLQLPLEFTIHVMQGLLAALDHAHQQTVEGKPRPVFHRDVSPHNILVSRDGSVKLADFGIAKAMGISEDTQTGMIKGKLAYLSPEQVRGEAIGRSSDLFSAGLVLFELLTSRRLNTGTDDHQILLQAHTPTIPDVPGISKELNHIFRKLSAPSIKDRYESATDALEAFGTIGIPGLGDKIAGTIVKRLLEYRELRKSPVESADVAKPDPVVEPEPQNPTQKEQEYAKKSETKKRKPKSSLFDERTRSSTDVKRPAPVAGDGRDSLFPIPTRTRFYIVLGFAGIVAVSLIFWALKSAQVKGNDTVTQEPAQTSVETKGDKPSLTPPVAKLPPVSELVEPDASIDTNLSHEDPSSDSETPQNDDSGSAKTGYLEVNVRPWAKVTVDGIDKGTTPLTKTRLKTGNHRVTLTNSELDYKKTIYVRIGNSKTTSINRTITGSNH